jgi:hypothetical protein
LVRASARRAGADAVWHGGQHDRADGWLDALSWPRLASVELAASMFAPTGRVIALLWGGLLEDIETLLVIEHVAMLPSMLVAMLLRREEYSGGVHGHRRHHREPAA